MRCKEAERGKERKADMEEIKKERGERRREGE